MSLEPEIWAEGACAEYRRSGTITFENGEAITGKPALDLFKYLDAKSKGRQRKTIMKPEDYLPKETKA